MNKHVYPPGIWDCLPRRISFSPKTVVIQFENSSLYVLFKQSRESRAVGKPGDWVVHDESEAFPCGERTDFEDVFAANLERAVESKQKFEGEIFRSLW